MLSLYHSKTLERIITRQSNNSHNIHVAWNINYLEFDTPVVDTVTNRNDMSMLMGAAT